MRSGDVRAAAAVAALALALVACGGDERAGTLPSPSPATVAPTTPTVTPSADYEAEVHRAIDAYFAALNAALRDPANRTDELSALIDPACSCRQVLELLRDLERDGHYIDYRYTVSDVRVQQAGSLGASVTYVLDKSAGAKRDASGDIVTNFAASRGRFSVHFRRVGSAWLIDRVDQMR